MCRLLGFVADHPTSANDVLGDRAFAEFTSLSCVHGDGWGLAAADGNGLTVRTSPLPAARDSRYSTLIQQTRAASGFVHLRWATDGLAVAPQNSHPFSDGELALAHNGGINPIARLEAMLSPQGLAALRGDTDSERYFQFVRDRIRNCGDESAGILSAVELLSAEFPQASLNAMLLSNSALYVVHFSSDACPPTEDLRMMFDDEAAIPAGHVDRYFQLSYRRSGGGIAVVSSGLSEAGWTPLPPNCVVRIDRAAGSMEFLR